MKNTLGLFLIIIIFNSCSVFTRFAFQTMGVFNKKVQPRVLNSKEKEVIFLPMHHIGKQEFYLDAKRYVDSLHRLGYIVFYENVTIAEKTDSSVKDTLLRKTRKLIGIGASGGYIDKAKGTFNGRKFKFLKKLDNQTLGCVIGLDSTIDRNVDITLNELIKVYEEKYRPIILDKCDFNTDLKDKYNCSKIKNRAGIDSLTLYYRNEFLSNEITNSSYNKIVVMYGSDHFKGLYKLLYAKDSTWQQK